MPRILAGVVAATALLLSVTLLGAAPASATTLREWTLSGVTFEDGGTLTGTLRIDSDGVLQRADLTTSGGNTDTFPAVSYGPSAAYSDYFKGYLLYAGSERYLLLKLPDTTGTTEGDSLPLVAGGYECTNCGAVRSITAGNIVAGGLIDTTAPEIVASVDPVEPDGMNGWYISAPTVTYTVNDPDGPITEQSGCDPTTLMQDFGGVTVTCRATSQGGTNTVNVTLNHDGTPPTLAPMLSVARPVLGGDLTVTVNAADVTSGVANATCTPISTAKAGLRQATCTAVDVAGNPATQPLPYTVEYVVAPLTRSKSWSPKAKVSVQTRLTDADNKPIPDSQAAALGCRVQLQLSGAQTHQGCLKYDKASNTFGLTWALGPKSGAATLKVAVSYPGSQTTTTRSASVRIG